MGDILANTEYGKVSGVLSLDYKSTGYYSFFGIPYAKPPIGALRFKAPQHPDHWVGIRDCTKVKDGCISRHLLTAKITGSEDCLYLNVYTKNLPTQTNKPRPVLVWIHGGAFMCGSGNPDVFGPEFLITQDIVIVAMSYRVGPLGFLCLEDESLDVPGNAGIKDVLMALRWVKDNIIHFNGDPNNITVGGQSSGAVITNFLMLIPQAKGLFNKAIIQSATALQNWALGKREGAKELAKILGLNSDNEQEILTYLRQVPAVDMLKASQKVRILADDAYCDNILAFNPIIEKPHPGAVIVENPLVTILRGNYTKVPLIMGYTDEEGLYAIFVVRNKQIIVEDFEKMIPHTLKLEKGTTESKKLAKKIKEFYFGDKEATNENLPMYLKLSSAAFFSHSVHRTARLLMKDLGHPIYFYRFSVDANLNIYKINRKYKAPGASHSDDTCYLFNTMLTPKLQEGSIEEKAVTRIVTLWGNFIKTGDPNQSEEQVMNVNWQPMQGRIFNFLDITNDGLVASIDPDDKVMKFWDDIYKIDPGYSYNKL